MLLDLINQFFIMKYLPIFSTCILFLFFISSTDGQENNLLAIPPTAKEYIAKHYHEYQIKKAEQEKDHTGASIIEVELKKGRGEIDLGFDLQGNYLFKEYEIKRNELPASVLQTIQSRYAGYKADEYSRFDWNNNKTYYEVELEKGNAEKDVVFDENGTVVQEEVETEESEKD